MRKFYWSTNLKTSVPTQLNIATLAHEQSGLSRDNIANNGKKKNLNSNGNSKCIAIDT